MMRKLCLAIVSYVALATPVVAGEEYIEYPANNPCLPFQRSFLSGEAVIVPPYDRAFPVRVYTTPPQQPYYNVPPYKVIAPY